MPLPPEASFDRITALLGEELKDDWQRYLDIRGQALDAYDKVIAEAEVWHKKVAAAIEEKAKEARQEHDDWYIEQTTPLTERLAQIQSDAERDLKRKVEVAETEYRESLGRVRSDYQSGKIPIEEATASDGAAMEKRHEAVAAAEAEKEESVAEPKKRLEAELDRLKHEYLVRAFPVNEQERFATKAAKTILEKCKALAEEKRDDVLESDEMKRIEERVLHHLESILKKTL